MGGTNGFVTAQVGSVPQDGGKLSSGITALVRIPSLSVPAHAYHFPELATAAWNSSLLSTGTRSASIAAEIMIESAWMLVGAMVTQFVGVVLLAIVVAIILAP